jgi:hypothetical protein
MRRLALIAAALVAIPTIYGADSVFSGPQPGERTTSFKVIEINQGTEMKERDPIMENAGAPTALVFVHAVERSLVPLLRVVDQYGAERKDLIKTEIVFLFGDRLQGEQRLRAVTASLKLHSRTGLSPDGAEGPGNYGLNKECMMTILAAKGNVVSANFALVQPGIADARRVIDALAKVCGDTNPPSMARLSAGPGGGMRRGEGKNESAAAGKDKFPGAVPTDEKLNSLLRRFIRPDNDPAKVDEILVSVQKHIQGNPELTRQAIEGWIRILHFGDRYGTEYSRKVGREFLAKLQAGSLAK